ncbi:hypothetical protein [Paenibacillus herberti]|uniref:DUF2642 domain-containing protein n=1 Tax=Paenibacillus herberti TaxID=1619309 RepID=A0A229P5P3_9BACL|nr:hypothetical protein [Paenibacillus herberti]OXM17169.1 hypothetical protein CGZ75_11310 [Paenibacillus herberti]
MSVKNVWLHRRIKIQLEGWETEGILKAWHKDLLVLDDEVRGREVFIPLHQVKDIQMLEPTEIGAETDAAGVGGKESSSNSEGSNKGSGLESSASHRGKSFSGYRPALMAAKGVFSEARLSASHVLHGYLAGLMTDFVIFCTPLHGAVLIPLQHLQALSLYSPGMSPYGLSPEQFPLRPLSLGLARQFEQQLIRLEGEMAVICRGALPDVAGVLGHVEEGFVFMTGADGQQLMLPLSAIHALFI